jgi:TPR repeat protein
MMGNKMTCDKIRPARSQANGKATWRRGLAGIVVGAALLLAGCATGMGGNGVQLPPPPATIAPFNGAAHLAALQDPVLQKAMMAAHQQDYAAALAGYRAAAAGGNPIGQFLLSQALEDGSWVTRDTAGAARQLQAAALAGYAPAQSYLGKKYSDGDGVPRDADMALRWTRFAAEQCEDSAATQLALAMTAGDGTARDVAGAITLLRRCAQPGAGAGGYQPSGAKGGPACQAMLAAIYLDGNFGVAADLPQAVSWMMQSAEQHMPVAEENLAELYEQGKGVPQDSAKAAYWRQRADADRDKLPGYWTQL